MEEIDNKIDIMEKRIENSKSLEELQSALTEYRDYAYNENDDDKIMDYKIIIYDNFDTSDLPVFGSKPIANTLGIYSWDDDDYMDGDWEIHHRGDI